MNIHAVFLFILSAFLWIFFISCDPKSPEPGPGIGFKKIYDRPDSYSFISMDIKQTGDRGYLILGMNEKAEPYLLKIDENGDYMWDTDFEPVLKKYEDPVSDLLIIKQGDREEYYFFCNEKWHIRKDGSRIAFLLKASEDLHQPVEVKLPDSPGEAFESNFILRPLRASIASDSEILFVAADETLGETLVVQIKTDDGGEAPYVRERYSSSCLTLIPWGDKRLQLAGSFNSMGKNYSYFQTISNEESGTLYYPACLGIRILAPMDEMPFEDNFLSEALFLKTPFLALEVDGTDWDGSRREDLNVSGVRHEGGVLVFYVNRKLGDMNKANGILRTELDIDKKVFVEGINVNGKRIVCFAGTTKNNQIVLYTYDRSTGSCLNREYFGDIHIYEAAGLIGTRGGGLVILGTTYIAGQLGRICLFKLSKDELDELAG